MKLWYSILCFRNDLHTLRHHEHENVMKCCGNLSFVWYLVSNYNDSAPKSSLLFSLMSSKTWRLKFHQILKEGDSPLNNNGEEGGRSLRLFLWKYIHVLCHILLMSGNWLKPLPSDQYSAWVTEVEVSLSRRQGLISDRAFLRSN